MIEDNVSNLNRLTDENCKSIDRINSSVSGIKSVLDIHSGVIDNHEKSLININKELHKLMKVEEAFEEFRDKSEKKFEDLTHKVIVI